MHINLILFCLSAIMVLSAKAGWLPSSAEITEKESQEKIVCTSRKYVAAPTVYS